MKKFILIVLLLAVLGGAGYYAYTQFYSNTSADMESVLPSGAIFYTRFSDVENNRQKIISTDVWKNWKKIDFKSLFSELNNTVVQQEDVQKFFDNITGPDAQNIYKKFLSTDVALAFYPTDFDYGSVRDMNEAKMLEKVFGGLFLVTRVSADVQAAEFLSRFVNNFGKNVTVRKVEYEGHTIQLIPLDSGDAEIGFVRFNDLMVLGIGESPAKRAIDVYKKTAPSLAEDAVIMKARKNALSSPDVFSFWDMAGYFRSMMTALNGLPNMQDNSEMFRQEMEDLERSFSGIEGFSLSVDIDTSLSTIKSDFYFNIDQMKNTALAELYTNCRPVENKTIQFIPQDVMAYYWGTCLDFNYYWNEIQRELAKSPGHSAQRIAAVEQTLGMSIEDDILPAFGNELGGYMTEIQTGGFFPVPRLALFVKTGDLAKARILMDKLVQQVPLIMPQEETYDGMSIKYLASPIPDVQPSYAFLDNYLLITLNRALMKSSIDTMKDKTSSLLENESFKEVNKGLTDKAVNVQYLKSDKFFLRLENIVEWGNAWAGSQEQKKVAFQAGAEKKLQDTKNQIGVLEQEIEELQNKILLVDDEIWNLETKNMDTTVKKQEKESIKNDIAYKKGEVSAFKEQLPEMEMMIQDYSQNNNEDGRQALINDFLYPFLKGLQALKTVGSKTVSGEGVLEGTTYIKL